MIAIVSDKIGEPLGRQLLQYFEKEGIETTYITADDKDIKPCYGCAGCTYKTYRKCVVRDDMDEIMPVLIRADIIIYLSQIKWGGLSPAVRKILEKSALMGNIFYRVRKGELRKGCIGKIKKLVGIGICETCTAEEKETFQGLIKETGIIMDIKYMAKIICSKAGDGEKSHGWEKKDMEELGKEIIAI